MYYYCWYGQGQLGESSPQTLSSSTYSFNNPDFVFMHLGIDVVVVMKNFWFWVVCRLPSWIHSWQFLETFLHTYVTLYKCEVLFAHPSVFQVSNFPPSPKLFRLGCLYSQVEPENMCILYKRRCEGEKYDFPFFEDKIILHMASIEARSIIRWIWFTYIFCEVGITLRTF